MLLGFGKYVFLFVFFRFCCECQIGLIKVREISVCKVYVLLPLYTTTDDKNVRSEHLCMLLYVTLLNFNHAYGSCTRLDVQKLKFGNTDYFVYIFSHELFGSIRHLSAINTIKLMQEKFS